MEYWPRELQLQPPVPVRRRRYGASSQTQQLPVLRAPRFWQKWAGVAWACGVQARSLRQGRDFLMIPSNISYSPWMTRDMVRLTRADRLADGIGRLVTGLAVILYLFVDGGRRRELGGVAWAGDGPVIVVAGGSKKGRPGRPSEPGGPGEPSEPSSSGRGTMSRLGTALSWATLCVGRRSVWGWAVRDTGGERERHR